MSWSWAQGERSFTVQESSGRFLWTESMPPARPILISQPYSHFLSQGPPQGLHPPFWIIDSLHKSALTAQPPPPKGDAADFPSEWPRGAFLITEDQPGTRLVLSWSGRKPWLKGYPRALIFDGERQTLSCYTEGTLLSRAHQEVIPYQAIHALWFSISRRRSAEGDLLLLFCVSYQGGHRPQRIEIPMSIKGLDWMAEAKDLLFRIAKTAKSEAGDAFRGGQGQWAFYHIEALWNAVKLSLEPTSRPDALPVNDITEAADYEANDDPSRKM